MRMELRKIEIDRGYGLERMMQLLRTILMMQQLDHFRMDKSGSLEIAVRVADDEHFEMPMAENFIKLDPREVLEGAHSISVVSPPGEPATRSVLRLFTEAQVNLLVPTGFLCPASCVVWEMLREELGQPINRDALFGWPVLFEESLPAETLILGASRMLAGSISDTTHLFATSLGA